MIVFYTLVFVAFFVSLGLLAVFSFILEDPAKKRITNIENMLSNHIEDAKFTIDTIQNIKTKVNNQDHKLDQILQKVS